MTPQEAAEQLFQAAADGDVSAARAALAAGADPTARNDWQETPLHYAAWGGHTDLARLLIEKGADPTARNDEQRTPLDWAVKNGHSDLVALLKDTAEDQAGHAERVVAKRRDNGEPPAGV